MIPCILERLEKARLEFTWPQLCEHLIPYATVMRWKARAKAGRPLLEKTGPKKKEPLPGSSLRMKVQQLQHGRRRSAGAPALSRP